jgi:hypothetical protein
MSGTSSAIGAGNARAGKGWRTAPAEASRKLYQPHSRIDNPSETFP